MFLKITLFSSILFWCSVGIMQCAIDDIKDLHHDLREFIEFLQVSGATDTEVERVTAVLLKTSTKDMKIKKDIPYVSFIQNNFPQNSKIILKLFG